MAGSTEERWLAQLILHLESRQASMFADLHECWDRRLSGHRHIDFSMNRVRMLIHFGVVPYMVFDGDYLPSKAVTEVERAKKREDSRKLGLELHRLGKSSQAHLELQKAVDVTPEMARQLIEELKKLGVKYIVAPYEADAQLAYLERKGVIQGILSEDSDLLVFGAKCLLTKLDQYGDCIEINRSDFTACREISLVGWSDAEFRRMAILSGCDYLTNINKMGLKTAYRLVRKYKTIEKILRMLQFDGQYHVPAGYLEAFQKAELTFLHQRVFCPLGQDIVFTTNLGIEREPEDFAFIGGNIDRDVAIGVANGDLHPMTKAPIVVDNVSRSQPRTPWGKTLKQALNMSSDIKPNKSIDSFFKTKRAPLAELDPNSFTPSPSQQRLLQQSSGTWHSNPAPIRPISSRSSVSLPLSVSQLLPSSIGSAIVSGVHSSLSASHPSKRRRLCVDGGDDIPLPQPSAKTETQQSRFFTSSEPEPSPLLKKNIKRAKRKGKDVSIWSDDSIEDAMAQLPDISDSQRSVKKGDLKVFRDEEDKSMIYPPSTLLKEYCCKQTESSDMSGYQHPVKTGELKVFEDREVKSVIDTPTALLREGRSKQAESQSSTSSKTTNQPDTSISTPATSLSSSASTVSQTLDEHVTAELAALEYNSIPRPVSERGPPLRTAAEHKVKLGDYRRRLHSDMVPQLPRQGSITPLQRLGMGALNRTQSCSASHDTLSSAAKRVIKYVPEVKRAKSFVGAARNTISPCNIGVGAFTAKGSEDTIIPDSEDDAVSVSEAEEAEKPTLNLGRFAFTG